MDEERKQQLSEERAEAYAPAPTGGAVMAGLCGGGIVLAADFILSGFYGWAVADNLLLAAGLSVAGFMIGAVGYLKTARAHRKATRAERKALDAELAGRRR